MSNLYTAKLNAGVGPFAPYLHTDAATAIASAPTGYQMLGDIADERVYKPPQEPGTPAFGLATATGSQLTFRVDNIDRIKSMYVELTVNAPGGTPGTYNRLLQCAPLRFFEAVTLDYQQQTFHPSDFMGLLVKALSHATAEKQADLLSEYYYSQSAGVRDTLALSTQTFRVPIPTYWFEQLEKAPYSRALPGWIELKLTMGRLANILETDYTNPTMTLTGAPRLIVEFETYSSDTKMYMQSLTLNSAQGLITLVQDWQNAVISASIGAGTTNSGALAITGLRRETPIFWVLIRPASFTTNYTTGFAQFDYNNLPNFVTLAYDNGTLLERVDVRHLIREFFKRQCTASEWPVIPINFAQVLEESGHLTSGSVDNNLLTNLTITMEWTAATTINLHAQVYAPTYNQVQQYNGQLIKVAN